LTLVFLVADRLVSLLEVPAWQVPAGLGAIAVLAGLLVARRRAASDEHAALRIDHACDLRERCSSADLLLRRAEQGLAPFEEAVVDDAEHHLDAVDPAAVAPVRLPGTVPHLLVAVAATILVGLFMPQLDLLGRELDATIARHEDAERHRIAKELREKSKALDRDMPLRNFEVSQTLVKELAELADQLEKERLPRRQAAVKLGKMADQLREEGRKLGDPEKTREALRRLKRDRSSMEEKQHLKSVEEALENGDLGKAADALRSLQDQIRESAAQGKLGSAEREELERELEDLAKRLEDKDVELAEQLQDAAKALEDKNLDGLDDALGDAAGDLDKDEALLDTLDRLQAEETEISQIMEDLLENDTCGECGKYFEEHEAGST
jgi:hypothetical protein